MKKIIALIVLTLITSNAYALRVEESDGSPSLNDVALIKVSNGSITSSGTREITVTTSSSTPDFGGVSGFVTSNAGAAVVTAMADDQVLVASGATTVAAKTIGDCDDSGGNHLNYDTATNAFSCGTSAPASASGWTDGGTDIGLTTTTDNVGIGGSPLGKLSIIGDTDEVQLHAKGNGTQTSNLMLLEDSAGTDVLSVSNAGNMILAGTLTLGGGSGAVTFGDGTTATYVSTYDLSGTDFTMTASSGTATFSGALASTTFDTGQGANELYDMDQNVLTTSSPTFVDATVTTEAYDATGWNGDNTVPTKDATRDKVEIIKQNSICGTTNSTFTATFYMSAASTGSSTEAATQLNISPVTGIVSNLYFKFQTAPDNGGGTQSWTIVAKENGSATGVTCAVSEASTSCSDTSNSFTLDAGNYMNFAITAAGTPANTGSIGYCYEFEATA